MTEVGGFSSLIYYIEFNENVKKLSTIKIIFYIQFFFLSNLQHITGSKLVISTVF